MAREYKKRIRTCLMLNHDRYKQFAVKLEPEQRLKIIELLVEYSFNEANHGQDEADKWLRKAKFDDPMSEIVFSIMRESVDIGIESHHGRARDKNEEDEEPG